MCEAVKSLKAASGGEMGAVKFALFVPPVALSHLSGNVAKYTATDGAIGCSSDTFDREVNDIKQETDSRAVAIVTIRNTTPIPAGVSPMDFQKEGREKGDRYRYVFTKVGPEWKLEDVYVKRQILDEYRMFADNGPSYPYTTEPF